MSEGKSDRQGGGGKRSRGRTRPGKRTLAREAAMKTLYLADLRPDLSDEEQDTLVRDSCPPEDAQEYARALVAGVRSHREEIDRVITDVTAPNWELRRMAAVDRNIIRVGCFELAFGSDEVPPAVAINEAVGLAKRFGAQNSGSFVNGVLDAIRRRGRAGEVAPPPPAEDEADEVERAGPEESAPEPATPSPEGSEPAEPSPEGREPGRPGPAEGEPEATDPEQKHDEDRPAAAKRGDGDGEGASA